MCQKKIRPPYSLIHEYFNAQVKHPVKGDWVTTIKQDLSDVNICMTYDEIRTTSKEVFKQTVKEKIKIAALTLRGAGQKSSKLRAA